MNRSPRRTSRIQPPLRGRLATVLSPEQKRRYSEPVVRKRPSISKSKPKKREHIPSTPSDKELDKNQIWQLLLILILLIILSIFIGNLF